MSIERKLKQFERWCMVFSLGVLILGVLFLWSFGVSREDGKMLKHLSVQ